MSDKGIFADRQDRLAPFRRATVWLLYFLIWAGILALFGYWWNSDGFLERAVTVSLLGIFALFSVIETWFSRERLKDSRDLLSDGTDAWQLDGEGDALTASSPWVKRVAYSVNEFSARTQNEDGSWSFSELPDASRFVDPVWNQADKSSTMLRWFAGGAVLVGLLGTLYGLGGAIDGALGVLAESGDSENFTSGFGAALAPLQYAFFASGAGVANSLGLILIRTVHQAEIDAHFGEIELELASRMHDQFFSTWRPPSLKFIETARELESLNENLMDTVEKIDQNTKEIIENSARTIEEKFEPLPDRIIKTMNEGMNEATTRAVGQVAETQRELINNAREVSVSLEELGRKLPEQVDHTSEKYASFLTQKDEELGATIGQLEAAVEEMETNVSTATEQLTESVGDSTQELKSAVQESASDLSSEIQASSTEMSESVDEATDQLNSTMTQSHEAFTSNVQETGDDIANAIESSTEHAREQLEELTENHRETVDVYDEKAQQVLEKYQTSLEETLESHEDATENLVEKYGSILDRFDEKLQSSVQGLADEIGDAAEQTDNALGQSTETALEVAERTDETADKLEGLVEGLDQRLAAVRASTDQIQQEVSGQNENVAEVTRDLQNVADKMEKVKEPLENLVRADTAHRQTLRAAIEDLDENLRQMNGAQTG